MDKPVKNFPWVREIEGHYDLYHPSEVQVQYVFILPNDAPQGLQRGYVVNKDHAGLGGSALEIARELQSIFSRYLFTSNKEKIAELIAYLEANEQEHYRHELAYRIANADYEIEKLQKERDSAQKELERLDAEKAQADQT